MQWIRGDIKRPKDGNYIPGKVFNVFENISYNEKMDRYNDYEGNDYAPEDVEWLDESELSFTIEDIKLAYNTGWSRGYNHNYDEADRYLKQQYNIDITK